MNTDSPEIMIENDADSVTYARPTKIFIGMCPDCKLPSRFEPDFPAVRSVSEFTTNCLHCDTRMIAERLWATETTGSCDARCMGATGKQCSCACGGVNHAGAFASNRYKSEATESAIQKLIQSREKRAAAAVKRRQKLAEKAAQPFNEWLSNLDKADAALVSWMSAYENVADAPTGILVDFRLRMMATPGKEAKYPARPLTDKQMDLAWKIVTRMSNECEREYQNELHGTPVPEGRFRVHGKVVSRRIDAEGYAGNTTYKILLQCDGYRLWGNCPSDLVDHIFPRVTDSNAEGYGKGVKELPADLYVEFNATVKQSDRDQFFGFFRNARSAQLSTSDAERTIPGLPEVTVQSAKRLSKPQSDAQPSPRPETSKSDDTPSEKHSAPRKSGSHADCTHEATKSARAKCRRERQSK